VCLSRGEVGNRLSDAVCPLRVCACVCVYRVQLRLRAMIGVVAGACSELSAAYVYVPSKEDLGAAALTKRPTSIVMVVSRPAFADAYAECEKEMRAALPRFG